MTLNMVTLVITEQDAADGASSGTVVIAPTSAVTVAGQTVVSNTPVTRVMSGGTVSVELVATDNSGTTPAAGEWAYQVTLPGGSPVPYLLGFADGASQRLDDLTPAVARTVFSVPAGGAAFGGGTLTEYLAPAVVTLTDAATILVDASLGNDFRVTLTADRAMGAPSNPADGQSATFEVTSGGHALTWDAAYDFGSGTAPDVTASATYLIGFRYSGRSSKWQFLGSLGGYA